MGKETKKKLEHCVDDITKESKAWWDYKKDEQVIINSLKSDGREEGLAEGLSKGLSQGRVETKLEIADKIKQASMDLQTISNMTSLSIEELKKI